MGNNVWTISAADWDTAIMTSRKIERIIVPSISTSDYQSLLQYSGNDYHFRIVDSPEVNADLLHTVSLDVLTVTV